MLKRLRGRARLVVAGGLVVLLVVGLTAVYAVVSPSRALGAQATLTILTGTVELREMGSGSFATGTDGGILGPGATVRTAADGNAIITFFDGSTVTVEPSSELTLEQLETTSDGNILISILQTVGRSWHVVGHKLTEGSQYQVRTPTATASVRGTAFEFGVDENGDALALTEEGLVQLASLGQVVDVAPDQQAEAPANEAPTAPVDAPPPDNVVKVIIDPTSSAAAVDSKGRAVSLFNGVPNVTVPRGKVEFVDGKIVMTVPTDATERVSTVVKADDPTKAVAIQTQVESKGVIVGNTLEVRAPDETGTARGGIAVTTNGVIVLPDAEAKQFGLPNIAKAPEVTGGGGLFGAAPVFPGVAALSNMPIPPTFTFAPGATLPTTFALPEGVTLPTDVKVGEFKGGFQQFSFFGFTQDITKQPGFDPTKATGLEFAAGGLAQKPTGFDYATFTSALPPGLVPPAPPGATDARSAAGFTLPAGFTFPPVQVAPPAGAGVLPFDPATIPTFNLSPEVQKQMEEQLARFQQIATQLQQSGAFSAPVGAPTAPGVPGTTGVQGNPITGGFPTLPFSPFASPGAPQGGVGSSPFQGGQLPQGCRDLGFLGVVCSGPAASFDPTQAAPINLPPCAVGQAASSTNPCVPGEGAAGAPGIGGRLPPCAAGQQPSQAAPCDPTSAAGAQPGAGGFAPLPPCAQGQLPSPASPCDQGAGGAGTLTCPPGTTGIAPNCQGTGTGPIPTCPPGTTGISPNCVGTAPVPGGAFPTCPPGTVPIGSGQCASSAPITTTCTAPQVLLPDGRCGTPTTTGGGGATTCTPPAVLLPDGKCGTAPTGTFVSCAPPLVILPDGRCGEAPTSSFTPFPSPTSQTGSTPFPSPTQGTFTCPEGTVQTSPNTCSAPQPSPTPIQQSTPQPTPAPTSDSGAPPPTFTTGPAPTQNPP
jgi:hypothetical protein